MKITLKKGKEIATVDAYIADTPEKRTRGLKYRISLPFNEGMLFIFDEPGQFSFWMKDTYLPLDLLFFNSDMKLLRVDEFTQPFSEDRIESPANCKYVLEVNGGFYSYYFGQR